MVQSKPSPVAQLLSTTAVRDFNYGLVGDEDRNRVSKIANEVRERVRGVGRAVIEIGQRLNEVKSLLPHGQWGPWLKSEFGWSERTAQRYMRAAEIFGEKSDIVSDLPATVIHVLAASATPAEVRDQVLAEVATGRRPTLAAVRQTVLKRDGAQRPSSSPRRALGSEPVRRQGSTAMLVVQRDRAAAATEYILNKLGDAGAKELAELIVGLDAGTLGASLLEAFAPPARGLISELTLD